LQTTIDKDGKAEVTCWDRNEAKMSGAMTAYIVRQGDYLAKLAFVHGFDADEVWNDPKNDELKQLRPNPNILAPGDILYIPEKKEEERPIEKGTENTYTATVPKVEVVLVFLDGEQPLANEPCEVRGLGEPASGDPSSTDDDGKLTLSVPVTIREVSVYFAQKNVNYNVRVGDMDPVSEPSGLCKRLTNLGFLPRHLPESANMNELLEYALLSFQKKKGLSPSGQVDAQTCEALIQEHMT
jgi:hypothetical protein